MSNTPLMNDEEFSALKEFHDSLTTRTVCNVPKPMLRRLCRLGVAYLCGGGVYGVSLFGYSLIARPPVIQPKNKETVEELKNLNKKLVEALMCINDASHDLEGGTVHIRSRASAIIRSVLQTTIALVKNSSVYEEVRRGMKNFERVG